MSERVEKASNLLEDIQAQIQVNPTDQSLSVEENKAQFMLSKVLKEEEHFPKKKSRTTNISLGDSNTRYFYNAISVRNARNGIYRIESPQGLLSSPKEIADEAVRFFSDALNPPNHLVIPKIIPFNFKLNHNEKMFLEADYSADEIKKIVMEAHPEKAPGPDGFPAIFYQKFWDLVGHDVTSSTLKFFSNYLYPKDWAANFICLIPKKLCPKNFSEFRPISLSL